MPDAAASRRLLRPPGRSRSSTSRWRRSGTRSRRRNWRSARDPPLALLRQLLEQSGGRETPGLRACPISAPGSGRIPTEIRETLREIQQSEAEIRLVACVRAARSNLGMLDVAPANETRAAGVPLFVDVQVKNFGADPARNVQLKVRTTFCDPDVESAAAPQLFRGKADELPTVLIEDMPAGQTATRRVQVFFPKPGRHVVSAQPAGRLRGWPTTAAGA